MKNKVAIVLLVLVVLLFIVPQAHAEDGNPSIDHNSAVALIVNTVLGSALAVFGTAPITVALVAVFKQLDFLKRFDSETIATATAVLLYGIAAVASFAGLRDQFENVLDLVTVVAPAVTSFIVSLTASKAGYHVSKALEVPVIGQAREEF